MIYFQNALNGEPSYNAEDFNSIIGDLITDGVFLTKNAFSFQVSTHREDADDCVVSISEGSACIGGAIYKETQPVKLGLGVKDSEKWRNIYISVVKDETGDFTFEATDLSLTDSRTDMILENIDCTNRLIIATAQIPPVSTTFYPIIIKNLHGSQYCPLTAYLLENIPVKSVYDAYQKNTKKYATYIDNLKNRINTNTSTIVLKRFRYYIGDFSDARNDLETLADGRKRLILNLDIDDRLPSEPITQVECYLNGRLTGQIIGKLEWTITETSTQIVVVEVPDTETPTTKTTRALVVEGIIPAGNEVEFIIYTGAEGKNDIIIDLTEIGSRPIPAITPLNPDDANPIFPTTPVEP